MNGDEALTAPDALLVQWNDIFQSNDNLPEFYVILLRVTTLVNAGGAGTIVTIELRIRVYELWKIELVKTA